DDLLDFAGDAAATGKTLCADLAEGKMTFPLLVGLERDRELRPLVAEVVERARAGQPLPEALVARVVASLRASGSLDECRALARARAEKAAAALAPLPPGNPAVQALRVVAETTVDRDR